MINAGQISIGVGTGGTKTKNSKQTPKTDNNSIIKSAIDYNQKKNPGKWNLGGEETKEEDSTWNRDTEREDKLREEDRKNYLEDRKHAEEREDSLYNRLYDQLTGLGLNPDAFFEAITGVGSGGATGSAVQQPNSYRSTLESIDLGRRGQDLQFLGKILQIAGTLLGGLL